MSDPAFAPSRRRFLFLGGAAGIPSDSTRRAHVALRCLGLEGVTCRACAEHCDPGTIGFELLPKGRSLAKVDPQRCDGCARCLPACPAGAIVLRPMEAAAA